MSMKPIVAIDAIDPVINPMSVNATIRPRVR